MSHVRKAQPFFIFAAVLLAVGGWFHFEARSRRAGEPETGPSPLARDVLKSGSTEWVHMAARHTVVHAQSRDTLVETARESDFAFEDIGRRLGLGPVDQKVHLFVIQEPEVWEDTLVRSGLRRDGLASHVGNEIFILQSPAQGGGPLQVPHEMVHLRLQQQYQQRLPLWLEEGLAGYLGWEVALAYAREEDRQLSRTMVPVTADQQFGLDDLTGMTDYPEGEVPVRAFYRQTEEFVRAIAQTVGRNYLGRFLEQYLGGGQTWRESLRDQFGCTDADVGAVEKAVRERSARETID